MKKLITFILAMIMLGTVLAACAEKDTDKKPGENNDNGDQTVQKLWTQKEAVLKLKGTGFTETDIKNCLHKADAKSFVFDNYYISITQPY